MADNRLRVGNVEILILTDAECRFPVPLDQLFPGVALEQWEPYRQRYPSAFAAPDAWHVHYGCAVLRSGGRTILVDTGIGPDAVELLGGAEGKLLDDLERHGVRRDEIDTVFMTHAHIDHVGWNLTAAGQPTFPNARYVLHEADWAAARQLESVVVQFGAPPYVDRTLAPLEGLGILDLFAGEAPLTPEVTALPTPGHTPGHMCVLITSAGERAVLPGDAIVHPAQVSEPDWPFGFDSDTTQASVSRRQLLDRIEAEGMTLAACHFPHPGFGRLVRLEGKRYWQAR